MGAWGRFKGVLSNRVRATVVALCVAGLSGCGANTDVLDGVPAFPVDVPEVRVLDEGENPQVLAYRAGDATWETSVGISGGVAQDVVPSDDAGFDPQAPAGGDIMETTLDLSVQSVPARDAGDGEGPASREVELTTRGGGHSDLALGQEVDANQGFLMRWRAADTGAVSSVKMLPPVDSPERGRQVVERGLLSVMSTTVVFPEEPVGVGAAWTVTGRVTGDAAMVRTTTYTVRSISGDEVQLDVAIEEQPTQQEVRIDNEVAGSLDGATLTVASTSTTSQGELTVDLTKPLPVAGQIAATTRLVYAGEGAKFRIVQDVTNAVTYGK